MNTWEIAGSVLRFVFGLASTPHRIVRHILGDTDEARYMEAGLYLIPTGLFSQKISELLGLNPLAGLLMWVVGVILVLLSILIIADKHHL